MVGCLVQAEGGAWGFGTSVFGSPVISVINEHFAPLLVGEDAMEPEAVWEMMCRMASPYAPTGLASYAISAVDLALWDLKGRVENQPVYELAGGRVRDKQFCYATGNDTDWHMELGFAATKLACPFGPADGERGLEANEELVSDTRDLIGPYRELMLDCWMAFDVHYSIALAERLDPYHLRWMEDCLMPEDLNAHFELRDALPVDFIATGEHWYSPHSFAFAAKHGLAGTYQPDICWAGGMTACLQIAKIAENAGVNLFLHAGMNTPYGQHLSIASKAADWGELFVGSAPGVPLSAGPVFPGMAVVEDGWLTPSDAPGFGHGLTLEAIEALKAD
jgi:L-rhamnonate dehydratase